jgi:hypothetical protein
MKRLGTAAALVCVLCTQPGGSSAQDGRLEHVLEPTVMAESFGGDSLGQWASYPPAQDVGYEPSLTPTADFDAPGGRALMRVVKPVFPGPLSIGFIKEIRVVISPGADLAFVYRLEPSALAGVIEVGLAGGDGQRYTWRHPASAAAWTRTATRLSSFRDARGRAPADGTAIEAVYVVAEIARATPDITCRFLLDDVRLSAARQASFDVRRPTATPVEPWRAQPSGVVYRAGAAIPIEAVAPVSLKSVAWSLTGAAGQAIARGMLHDDGASGDRKAGDGTWSHSSAYRVAAADPRGVWRLTLDGATADGRRVETNVRLLVSPPLAAPHPRLYFDAADAEKIRAKRQHPALTTLWASVQKAAASSRDSSPIAHGGDAITRLDSTYLLPTLPGYFDVLNRARARITNNAAVGFLDNDRSARDAARTALLEVARWQTWVPPWFEAHGQHTYYPVGQLASAVALAYDVLYDDLTADERQLVRRALMQRAILPTWREYVLDNRVMANTSNWISHTVGGALIAASAIFGDGSPADDEALALPVNGLLMKIEDHMAAAFLADGSYGEGISYLEFDLETLGPSLLALERVFGQSYWEHTHVIRSLQYPLHTLADPISESLDMGDTHPPAGHSIAPVVARSTDPVIRWFGSRFERRTIFDFLFFDERVAPKPPSGPGSRIFHVKGDAVFRTGWDADAGLVLFRAGPTFNHNHSDQGSFQFRVLGETMVTEAGWSDYYKDPYYDTFFTQAAGHNTLLIDGNPASQDIADTAQFAALNRHARITDATLSPFYDAVGSDLTPVYRGRLESYTRRLAYLKPDYLIVFDRVRIKTLPARLTSRLHVAAKSGLTVTETGAAPTATYSGARAAMAVRAFSSVKTRFTPGDGHIPYPVFSARTPPTVPMQPAYLDLASVDSVNDAWFMVALVPAKNIEAANASAAKLTSLASPGWSGLRVQRDGTSDVVLFRTDTALSLTQFENWRTDAEAMTFTTKGADVRRFGGQRVRDLRHDDRPLIAADRPVNLAVEFGVGSLNAWIRSDTAARVRVAVPNVPSRVTLNGTVTTAVHDAATGLVTLDMPAGPNAVAISWSGDR